MAQPVLLPAAFDGMAQDFPRNNMPKGKAWSLVDYIPESLGAPATERGGWAFVSAALSAVDASATFVKAMLYAPFNAGAQLLAINDTGNLAKEVAGVNTLVGAAIIPIQNPFMHQQIVVIPSPDGTTAPKKYDGVNVSALGGTAPAGKYGCVFDNYSFLGGTSAEPQRGYASAVNDPTAYVQTGTLASYLDVSFPIRAMAALPSVMLWFGDSTTARVRGTTPPPNSDMQVDDPIFSYGTSDARSVAVNGSVACFANDEGVFLTNGTAFPEDLTKSCGISKYWRDLCTGRTASWTLAGDWFGAIYVICVMNGTTLLDTILIDTKLRSAYRVSNLKSMAFAAAGAAGQELYAGSRATARIMQLSTMWTPGSSFKSDGDGAAVVGVYESPFYNTGKIGGQRWMDLFLEYDLRDAAADGPTMTVAYTKSPEAGAPYMTMSPVAAATTMKTLAKIAIHDKSMGIGFKITRANAASYARLYGIGSSVYQREGSRRDYS